jgi:hypothetical protein
MMIRCFLVLLALGPWTASAQGTPPNQAFPARTAELEKWFNQCPSARELFSRAGIEVNSSPTTFDAAAYRSAKIAFNNLAERKKITQLEGSWLRYDTLLRHFKSNTPFEGATRKSLETFINEEIHNGRVEDRNNLVALHGRLWNKPLMGAMQSISPEKIESYLENKKLSLQSQILPLKQAFEQSGNGRVATSHLRAMEAGAPKAIGMSLQYMEEGAGRPVKKCETYGRRKNLTLFKNSAGAVTGYQVILGVNGSTTTFADVVLKNQCEPTTVSVNTFDGKSLGRSTLSLRDCQNNLSADSATGAYKACELVYGMKTSTAPEEAPVAPVNK